jgi:hypothetical protein
MVMGELRSFDCPETGERCEDPQCSLSYCHERERTEEAEANRKAEKARTESQRAKDRHAAARIVLKELIAEQNAEPRMNGQPLLRMPRRREKKEELIAKILASPRHVQRLRSQIDALRKERESRIGPRLEPLPGIPSVLGAERERLRHAVDAFPEAERAELWEQIKKAYLPWVE